SPCSHEMLQLMKAQPEFSIRRAMLEDAAGMLDCLQLAVEPYRQMYSPQGFRDTVLTPETLPARLEAMSVFVAVTARHQIIGTIGCTPISGRENEGHIRGMAVHPDWQGQRGVAQSLLAAAEEHLGKQGCTRVTLDTTA